MTKVVAHITSVHNRKDRRIVSRQCSSIASSNYKVFLIVADGRGDDFENNVEIIDIGKPQSRFERAFITSFKMYKACKYLDTHIYHIHDPELIFVGLLLKIRGKVVIFDMHENVGAQILTKHWIPESIRPVARLLYKFIEYFALSFYDAVVLAETCYEKLNIRCKKIVTIRNYPKVSEFIYEENKNWKTDNRHAVYVGGIEFSRGLEQMVNVAPLVKCKIVLAGPCDDVTIRKIGSNKNWNFVKYLGVIDKKMVADVLKSAIAGLVVLHPLENYCETEPTKMLEYMASGIPVVASNFEVWRNIVEGLDCGICVDPFDTNGIAEAIDFLVQNPDIAKRMGENGRKAVLNKYNWANEEKKLLNFYSKIIEGSA